MRTTDHEISAFAPKWQTVATRLRVLAIIHNVTSATRMMDVLQALENDPRVQVVLTWTRSSVFRHGVEEFLQRTGYLVLDWEQALEHEFDLAIGTSLGGEIHRIKAPFLSLQHGMGYNKHLNPETRKPGNPETQKPVFGLSREWLLHDGELLPSTIVLTHDEQLERLAADCPEAVPAALVAGDPCYDRILASLPHRAHHRKALGIKPHQKLALISSTWGKDSLFGRHPRVASRLLGALPADEYRVAIALHPNIWHGHGTGQVEAWIADARRAGLIVLPPDEGWRAALVATDVIIGDLGSVAFYGAALGIPVVLDHGGLDAVSTDSPVADFLPQTIPYTPQAPVTTLIARAHDVRRRTTELASPWVTSRPGECLALLRKDMYRLMGADEPDKPVVVTTVPAPEAEPGPEHPALWVSVTVDEYGTARVRRLPAATLDRRAAERSDAEGFLLVWDDEPDRHFAATASTVLCHTDDLPEDEHTWARRVFRHRAAYTAIHYDATRCVVHTRTGRRTEYAVEGATGDPAPDLLPSLIHHGLIHNKLNPLVRSGNFRLQVHAAGEHAYTVTSPPASGGRPRS